MHRRTRGRPYWLQAVRRALLLLCRGERVSVLLMTCRYVRCAPLGGGKGG
jgi:hypothetical protein